MRHTPVRRRRSVLYVPAGNERALAKTASLDADVLVFDLEDAVDPSRKIEAREMLRAFFQTARPIGKELAIRINPLASEWGGEDLLAACASRPDAILVPKVNVPRDILDVRDALGETDAPDGLQLWAMAETPRFLLNIREIAELGADATSRLTCFVAGTNDLAKDTGVDLSGGRAWFSSWLMQIVLAGRAAGIDIIDGVYNDFADTAGFAAECAQARAMGFDGKSLVHPAQIETANAAFSPSAAEIAAARTIVNAFAEPQNAGRGVIAVDGRMIERLHLAMAERVLARSGAV